MTHLQTHIDSYLEYCRYQRRLDGKTLKAYQTDLTQFSRQIPPVDAPNITPEILENFIAGLHQTYKPRTAKRKIASLKAFFHYLEYREQIEKNPFSKLRIKFREPSTLPKTIPLSTVETFLRVIYRQRRNGKTDHQRKSALRDVAVIEMLFATGIRISELCSLNIGDVNTEEGIILINGKGSKERRIQIGNSDIIQLLNEYKTHFLPEIRQCQHFFVSMAGEALTDQAVRRMINKYTALAAIELHITPHMFRHTFATCLLEADVDIRYIQEILGHSSIHITELYTHVAMSKQRDILATKHPRKDFQICP